MVAEASRRAKHKGFTKQFAGATLPSIMIVQCNVERLSEADRFEPFARHQEGLRRAIREITPEPIDINVGHLAVDSAIGSSEEIVGSLTPADANNGVCITYGPGDTASAFSLGPGESLL